MQEERWIIVMSAWQSQENSRLPYYAMVGICSNHRSKKMKGVVARREAKFV